MKPKSFYSVADEFGSFFDDKPIERVDTIDIVPRGFSPEFLKQVEADMKKLGIDSAALGDAP